MKIVFIINSIKYKAGIERVACQLANLFVNKLNCKISIINRDTKHADSAYLLHPNINVLVFDGNYLIFLRKIQNFLNYDKPDYIIIHNMGRLSLLCTFLTLNNTKLISLEHSAFTMRPKWIQFLSKLLYNKLDIIITLTTKDEENYKSWHNNTMVIHNSSPFSIFSDPNPLRKNKIIAIGRLNYGKNIKSLLKAWYLIKNNTTDWSLEIYGMGEEYQNLQNFIIQKKLKNVYLMGQADNVENIYKQSSIFVMSSRFEGLPMVLIEAQTFGLPIIAFDCPHGPAEIVKHNVNGFLVENQNIELLAQSMLTLINDPQKIKQFSHQALIDAQRFQEENILSLWKNKVFGGTNK